jgi:enoyl-CoA hydratase
MIRCEVDEAIAVITLDRPEKLNALTLAMFAELGAIFGGLKDDASVRAIVITGAGSRAFCAGADLTESIAALATGKIGIESWDAAYLKGEPFLKPVIAAVNGLCLGGGFELLLACDIRVAAQEARFSFPEPSMGFVPAAGTLARLVRQIPYAYAMELLLTAQSFSADRLRDMGVLNAVVPGERCLSAAMGYARQIAAMSPAAIQQIKKAALTLPDLPLAQAFRAEAEIARLVFTSDETRQALRSFADRHGARAASQLG